MTQKEYNEIQERFLDTVIKHVDPGELPMRFLNRDMVVNDSEIYKSAVASPDPITAIYTGMGSERSKLVKDRIDLLINDGKVAPSKIKLLSLNIAKAAEFKKTTQTDAMTYNDFCTNLFLAQFPEVNLADDISIKNALMLYPQDNLRDQLIKVMNMNSQDQIVFLELFINQHLDETIKMIKFIRKVSHKIASVIMMNYVYRMTVNPYSDAEEIILYNAQNIPVPCLCTILLFTQRHHNTLYILNAECETIFQFAGAAPSAISRLEAVHISRFNINHNVKMDPDILAYLNNPMITTPKVNVMSTSETITEYLDKHGLPDPCEMILTRNKKELEEVETWLKANTTKIMRKISASNSAVPPVDTWAVDSLPFLLPQYPYPNKITIENYTNILCRYMDSTETMKGHENEVRQFMGCHFNSADMVDIYSLTAKIIDCVAVLRNIETEKQKLDLIADSNKPCDIVLSTIHGAVDMRADHVFIITTNLYDTSPVTNHVLRVAESRSNRQMTLVLINATR